MNDQLWDSAYNSMERAFSTGEALAVGQAVLSFDAVMDHLHMDEEVAGAFRALLRQTGTQSVCLMRDLFKHKCAKAYANWVITVYEMEHRNEKV